MPKVTVYIRNEDMEAWRDIEKKAEFIHEALSSYSRPDKDTNSPYNYIAGTPTPNQKKTIQERHKEMYSNEPRYEPIDS